jgi:hypothetical protein
MAATLSGWVIDALLEPLLGMGPTLLVSFVGSTIVFFVVRNWLKGLRDG